PAGGRQGPRRRRRGGSGQPAPGRGGRAAGRGGRVGRHGGRGPGRGRGRRGARRGGARAAAGGGGAGSADWVAAFWAAAAAAGGPAEGVQGRWPEVAGRVPVADVVVCHHVLYNVADLAPFADALTTHARPRVVGELTDRNPLGGLGPVGG